MINNFIEELNNKLPRGIMAQSDQKQVARCKEYYLITIHNGRNVLQQFEIWSPHAGGYYWDEMINRGF